MHRTLDIYFRVIGADLPADHGYALVWRDFPHPGNGGRPLECTAIRVSACTRFVARALGNGRRLIGPDARFGLRLPSDLLPRCLKLAGKSIDLDGYKLRIGVGQTRALVPAATLHCRIATTRNGDDPNRFDAEIGRQLAMLDIRGKVFRAPQIAGESGGRDPSRRIVRVKGKRIVGYAVLATELTAEESIRLQEHGLGGRRRMGCGAGGRRLEDGPIFFDEAGRERNVAAVFDEGDVRK